MDLLEYIRTLKRRWPFIVAAVLLAAAIAWFTTPAKPAPITRTFRATNTMLLNGNSGLAGGISINQLPLFTTTGEVPKRVAERLGYDGEPAALAAEVTAFVDPTVQTFTVTSEQLDGGRAAEVANAFAMEVRTFLAEQQDKIRQDRLSATLKRMNDLEQQGRSLDAEVALSPNDEVLRAERDAAVRNYSAVYETYQNLVAEEVTNIGLTQLEEAAPVAVEIQGFQAPRSRSGRVPLAGGIGLLLGVGFALLVDRVDNKVRTRDRAERSLTAPVIAEIPTMTPRQRTQRQLLVTPDQHGRIIEAFRTMRTSVQFLAQDAIESKGGDPDGRLGVIVVTSPSPSEGKTTGSANLAAAFAETGKQVIVVNADFRRPKLGQYFAPGQRNWYGFNGMKDLLAAPVEQLLQPTIVENVRMLDLSEMPASPGDLARIAAVLVRKAADHADVVVVDTPPLSVTAEALEFVENATAVVVMIRNGRTSITSAEKAGDLLKQAGAEHVAVVMTATGKPTGKRYRYYTYYSNPRKAMQALGEAEGAPEQPTRGSFLDEIEALLGDPPDSTIGSNGRHPSGNGNGNGNGNGIHAAGAKADTVPAANGTGTQFALTNGHGSHRNENGSHRPADSTMPIAAVDGPGSEGAVPPTPDGDGGLPLLPAPSGEATDAPPPR